MISSASRRLKLWRRRPVTKYLTIHHKILLTIDLCRGENALLEAFVLLEDEGFALHALEDIQGLV